MKRRNFLEHVGWTGAGIAYAMTAGGIARAAGAPGDPFFVQISDSHIGFHQSANPDVSATLKARSMRSTRCRVQPKFVVHTGDITHLSTQQQFDDARAILSQLRAPLIALPGEHDVLGNEFATAIAANFGIKEAEPGGWASWDDGGVHYIVVLNVFNFEKMGLMGNDQLAWLKKDLAVQYQSTPIVVFAHVPLYALYPQWGWTTEDGVQAPWRCSPASTRDGAQRAYPPDRHSRRGQHPLRIRRPRRRIRSQNRARRRIPVR